MLPIQSTDKKFTDGSPATGVLGTIVDATWLNGVQEELLNVMTAAGINPEAKNDQVATAIKALLQGQAFNTYTTGGAGSAFTVDTTNKQTTRLRICFTRAVSSGSSSLSLNAAVAKAIKQYDNAGVKIDARIAAGQLADVEFDGTDYVILDPLPASSSARQITVVGASVAGNALTVTASGGVLDFRAADLASGTVNSRSYGNLSLTVPAAATLGTTSAQTARLILLALDNAGTIELAVCNLLGGSLDDANLISTTAISAGATAANVIYSATARTSVPFRVVGFIDIQEAAAGTWATAPVKVQGCGGQAKVEGVGFSSPSATGGYQKLPSGLILQWGNSGAVASGGSKVVTLPIAFPNAGLIGFASIYGTAAGVSYSPGVSAISTTQITVNQWCSGSGSLNINWLAIGY